MSKRAKKKLTFDIRKKQSESSSAMSTLKSKTQVSEAAVPVPAAAKATTVKEEPKKWSIFKEHSLSKSVSLKVKLTINCIFSFFNIILFIELG